MPKMVNADEPETPLIVERWGSCVRLDGVGGWMPERALYEPCKGCGGRVWRYLTRATRNEDQEVTRQDFAFSCVRCVPLSRGRGIPWNTVKVLLLPSPPARIAERLGPATLPPVLAPPRPSDNSALAAGVGFD